MTQALLQHNKPANSAVAVLKRMYGLKLIVEVDYIFKRNVFQGVVLRYELFHSCRHFIRSGSNLSAYFVSELLIFAYSKPIFPAVSCACFQYLVKFLDKGFCKRLISAFDNIVYAAEVIDRLNYIVNVDCFILKTQGICLEDIACLIVGEFAAFNMV